MNKVTDRAIVAACKNFFSFARCTVPKRRQLITTTPNGHTVIDSELLMQDPDVIEVLQAVSAKARRKRNQSNESRTA